MSRVSFMKNSSSPNSNPNVKAPFSSTTPENLFLNTSDISLISIVDYKRLFKIRISEKCPSLLDIVDGGDEKTPVAPAPLTTEEKLDENKVMIQQAIIRVYAQSLRDVEKEKISFASNILHTTSQSIQDYISSKDPTAFSLYKVKELIKLVEEAHTSASGASSIAKKFQSEARWGKFRMSQYQKVPEYHSSFKSTYQSCVNEGMNKLSDAEQGAQFIMKLDTLRYADLQIECANQDASMQSLTEEAKKLLGGAFGYPTDLDTALVRTINYKVASIRTKQSPSLSASTFYTEKHDNKESTKEDEDELETPGKKLKFNYKNTHSNSNSPTYFDISKVSPDDKPTQLGMKLCPECSEDHFRRFCPKIKPSNSDKKPDFRSQKGSDNRYLHATLEAQAHGFDDEPYSTYQ